MTPVSTLKLRPTPPGFLLSPEHFLYHIWDWWTLRKQDLFWRPLLLLLLSCFSPVRLCDPIDSSPPGSPIPGILQARTLEWVAISFSNAWKWKVKVKLLSRVWPSATPLEWVAISFSNAWKWKVKVKSLSHVWLFATPWTDCSLPGSSVHGIFLARVLESGAIAFSDGKLGNQKFTEELTPYSTITVHRHIF